MRRFTQVQDAFEDQRGQLLLWAPVFLALGIGVFFALKTEPSQAVLAAAGLSGLMLFALGLWWRATLAMGCLVCGLVFCGIAVAGWRAQTVAAPVLGFRYYGPVEGRLVVIDRSVSDRVRLTFDRVVLSGVLPEKTPRRVRVSISGELPGTHALGSRLILTAHLAAPTGPVEPGGFDFRRHAWFQGIGAVGYTRTPVLRLRPAEEGWPLAVARFRKRISDGVRARVPGQPGAVAAALITGDRSHIAKDTLESLRAANLAHLLAISGLHMGLVAGVVFGAVRFGLACLPWVALRWPIKKLAAGAGLCAGAVYLVISGGSVATERAFVMVAVALGAVLIERRALTLRAVAVAALIVLVLRPESLLSPGFQMSFAATTALVVAFSVLRELPTGGLPKLLRPVLALFVSSAVAGAATAPFAAAHFNQIAQYGLIANLLSVPLMGTVVVPAALLAALLAVFGGAGIGLAVMALGIRWILGFADLVAGLEGATIKVVTPPAAVLPLLALGALTVFVWQGRARLLGVIAMAGAAALWSQATRPPVLVAAGGGLVGIMGDQGRVLSKPRGSGFVAESWLENDGDRATQAEAASRKDAPEVLPGWQVVHVTGRGAADRVVEACAQQRVVISSVSVEVNGTGGCILFDRDDLTESGSLAIYPGEEGPRILSAAERSGRRLWSSQ
ncbi:MAG: ComEC/Rec2 family competence protein [Pseudomonadota bacterium]